MGTYENHFEIQRLKRRVCALDDEIERLRQELRQVKGEPEEAARGSAMGMSDIDRFVRVCDSLGLRFNKRRNGMQDSIQFYAEQGNGPRCGPVFYFDPDGSFVCQE